jgi:hypothetical protein
MPKSIEDGGISLSKEELDAAIETAKAQGYCLLEHDDMSLLLTMDGEKMVWRGLQPLTNAQHKKAERIYNKLNNAIEGQEYPLIWGPLADVIAEVLIGMNADAERPFEEIKKDRVQFVATVQRYIDSRLQHAEAGHA